MVAQAEAVRKEQLESRVASIVESFLDNTEMLASLAVDMSDHYQRSHGQGQEMLKGLESRRNEVEAKLANFVKAIGMGIINDSTQEAMATLEEQKKELNAAIQAEHVKESLFEDEASIGTFYRRFAHATMGDAETRELLFDYFVDKVFVGADSLTVASWFFDHSETKIQGVHVDPKEAGEALNIEFVTSPSGGDGGVWFQDIVYRCLGT